MSYTGADYQTTADLLEAHQAPAETVEFYREQATIALRREAYALELGCLASQLPARSPSVVGAQLVGKLLADGWKSPEGLF